MSTPPVSASGESFFGTADDEREGSLLADYENASEASRDLTHGRLTGRYSAANSSLSSLRRLPASSKTRLLSLPTATSSASPAASLAASPGVSPATAPAIVTPPLGHRERSRERAPRTAPLDDAAGLEDEEKETLRTTAAFQEWKFPSLNRRAIASVGPRAPASPAPPKSKSFRSCEASASAARQSYLRLLQMARSSYEQLLTSSTSTASPPAPSPAGHSLSFFSFRSRTGLGVRQPPQPPRPLAATPAAVSSDEGLGGTSGLPGYVQRRVLRSIMRRPLLQTTLFLHYNMAQLRRQGMSTAPVPGGRGGACAEPWLLRPGKDSSSASSSSDRSVAPREGSPNVEHLLCSVQDIEPPRRYQRALTRAARLVQKVHPIDNITRQVDNEHDDLVVYAGTVLMGWLEVVSLLGRGSCGQVFLCKDLRVCDGHFAPPAALDGENHTYWSCSDDYLPGGQLSAPPRHDPLVAVKVVKAVREIERHSIFEAESLALAGAQQQQEQQEGAEPAVRDPGCQFVATLHADGVSFGHHCIVMERYGANLYNYARSIDHRGMPMYQIQRVGRQLLRALTMLHHECRIIHADVKPENLLLRLQPGGPETPRPRPTGPHGPQGADGAAATTNNNNNYCDEDDDDDDGNNESGSRWKLDAVVAGGAGTSATARVAGFEVPSVLRAPQHCRPAPSLHIKLIDFSSSCRVGGACFPYIQSRYYRAPEVLVGAPYGTGIDVWSAGCVLAELLLGMPLLPGANEHHQLLLIEEFVGPLPQSLLESGEATGDFYAREAAAAAEAGGDGQRPYRLRGREEFLLAKGLAEVEYKSCYALHSLRELLHRCPLTEEERRLGNGIAPYAPDEGKGRGAGAGTPTPSAQYRADLSRQRFQLFLLLRRLLNPDPAGRISAAEALEDPFFSSPPPQYMIDFSLL